jgi:hypothetical protein
VSPTVAFGCWLARRCHTCLCAYCGTPRNPDENATQKSTSSKPERDEGIEGAGRAMEESKGEITLPATFTPKYLDLRGNHFARYIYSQIFGFKGESLCQLADGPRVSFFPDLTSHPTYAFNFNTARYIYSQIFGFNASTRRQHRLKTRFHIVRPETGNRWTILMQF